MFLRGVKDGPEGHHQNTQAPSPPLEQAETTKESIIPRKNARGKSEPASAQDNWQPSENPIAFEIDKAWHGIHFLLAGSAWEGGGSARFCALWRAGDFGGFGLRTRARVYICRGETD